MPRRRQRPRSRRRLDDDRGVAEGRDEPVPSQEAPLLHVDAIGDLGEQTAGPDHTLEEIVIVSWVWLVEADRKDDDRSPSPVERPFMGGTIDADRPSRDHHDPLEREPPREAMGEIERFIIGQARPDDRNRTRQVGELANDADLLRRIGKIAQPARILITRGRNHPRPPRQIIEHAEISVANARRCPELAEG